MLQRLRQRQEWLYFRVLPRADRRLAFAWYAIILLQAVLPAALAISIGVLVGAVEDDAPLAPPLIALGVIFVLLQVLNPMQQTVSANLGDRTAAYLHDRLATGVVSPPGMGHLEDPNLTADLTVARDFDLGVTGPPLFISTDFIASGAVQLLAGFVSALVLFGYTWWAPLLLAGAWLSTHYLLRESSVWKDRNTERVQAVQRDADYAYRIAVDPPAAKELRLFGLAGWTLARFKDRRAKLHRLQYEATRLRERPVLWCLAIVIAANCIVFWSMGSSAANGSIGLDQAVVFAQVAVGTSLIAFGGLNWALDGAAAPVAAARGSMRRWCPPAQWLRGPVPPPRCRPTNCAFAMCISPIPRGIRPSCKASIS